MCFFAVMCESAWIIELFLREVDDELGEDFFDVCCFDLWLHGCGWFECGWLLFY